MDFWQYFKDYLAFPFIRQKNALAVLMKGLALTMDSVRKDIAAMRDQFVVPKCDNSLITSYGLSRGVPRTRFDNDRQFRTRVERALAWHKLGGKNEGLVRILAEYGYPGGEIENLRHKDPAKWATFNINLLDPGSSLDQEKVAAIYEIANMYKPARSKIQTVSFALRQYAPVYVFSSQRKAVTVTQTVRFGKFDVPHTWLYPTGAQVSRITFRHLFLYKNSEFKVCSVQVQNTITQYITAYHSVKEKQ